MHALEIAAVTVEPLGPVNTIYCLLEGRGTPPPAREVSPPPKLLIPSPARVCRGKSGNRRQTRPKRHTGYVQLVFFFLSSEIVYKISVKSPWGNPRFQYGITLKTIDNAKVKNFPLATILAYGLKTN